LLSWGLLPCHFSDHNAALKFTRDTGESNDHRCQEYIFSVALQETAVAADMPLQIPFIVKKEKGGEAYAFSTTICFAWGPVLLLANLKEDDLRKVVHGPAGTSGGIVKCCCSAMDKNYGHKRETS